MAYTSVNTYGSSNHVIWSELSYQSTDVEQSFAGYQTVEETDETESKVPESPHAILLKSIVLKISYFLIITLSMALIVVGIGFIHDCPGQKMIPISFVVFGSVTTLGTITHLVEKYNFRKSDPQLYNIMLGVYVVIYFFLTAWLVAIFYWANTVSVQDKDKTKLNYCHPMLYNFAYWLLGCLVILVTAKVCCNCCCD